MAERLGIYKCEICGNIVEVLNAGVGELVCCGKPMVLQNEKSEEEGTEKHLPVIEKTENGLKIKVGSIPHPMEEAHYIRWIEVIKDGKVYRQELKPDELPEAQFDIDTSECTVREYCNIHGLWITKY